MIIHGKIDEVMRLTMKKLDYQIPQWQLTRKLRVTATAADKLQFCGVDTNGAPYDFVKNLIVTGASKAA